MADVERYAKDILNLVEHAKEFDAKIRSACGGSFTWGAEQVIDSYLSMYDRFCPFKIGDRVRLNKDVVVDPGSGWYHCIHFLKKGAKATVSSRGYSNGHFSFEIVFDAETWIDKDGIEQPVKSKHCFHFSETSLTKLD